jgi:hypothetical protein
MDGTFERRSIYCMYAKSPQVHPGGDSQPDTWGCRPIETVFAVVGLTGARKPRPDH